MTPEEASVKAKRIREILMDDRIHSTNVYVRKPLVAEWLKLTKELDAAGYPEATDEAFSPSLPLPVVKE